MVHIVNLVYPCSIAEIQYIGNYVPVVQLQYSTTKTFVMRIFQENTPIKGKGRKCADVKLI